MLLAYKKTSWRFESKKDIKLGKEVPRNANRDCSGRTTLTRPQTIRSIGAGMRFVEPSFAYGNGNDLHQRLNQSFLTIYSRSREVISRLPLSVVPYLGASLSAGPAIQIGCRGSNEPNKLVFIHSHYYTRLPVLSLPRFPADGCLLYDKT